MIFFFQYSSQNLAESNNCTVNVDATTDINAYQHDESIELHSRGAEEVSFGIIVIIIS